MIADYEQQARVFKAFSDEKRLHILSLLRDGERCACVLMEEMHMPQSNFAYHMKILAAAGIVVSRQEGKWYHYHINPQGRAQALQLLSDLTAPARP